MGSNPIMLQQRSLPMTLQQVHLCYNCMYNTCQNLYLQLGDLLPTGPSVALQPAPREKCMRLQNVFTALES